MGCGLMQIVSYGHHDPLYLTDYKIEIKSNNQYIFYKNHKGKKEIFSDNYINTFFTFLKDVFNFNLIK